MANNTAKIAELVAILQSGVTTVTVNGTTTNIDLNVIRQQLAELRRNDDVEGARKPRVIGLDVGGLMGGPHYGSNGGTWPC